MQPEPGEQGLPRLLTEGDVATLRRPIVLSVDTEEVKMFTTPVKGGNFMELGAACFCGDQEALPYQGTAIRSTT